MTKKTKKWLLSGFGVVGTTVIASTPLWFTEQTVKNQPMSFYSITNTDNGRKSDNKTLLQTNAQTLTTKNENLVVLAENQINFYNVKGELISKITDKELKILTNQPNSEFKMSRIFEQNNRLFILAGSQDLYDQPLSTTIAVFNLDTLEFDQILPQANQPLNVIQSINDNKVLFYNSKASLKDLKNNSGAYVYDFATKTFNYQFLTNLAWDNQDDNTKAYLLNVINVNGQTYMRIVESQFVDPFNRTTTTKIRKVNSDLSAIAGEDWKTLSTINDSEPNAINYAFSKFDNGEKIYNLDYNNTTFTKLNDDRIVFVHSNYRGFGIAIESFNPKTGEIYPTQTFDFNQFKTQTQFGANDANTSFTKDINNNDENWVKQSVFDKGLKFLSVIPETDNTLLLTMATENPEPEWTHGIFTKGRILRLTFNNKTVAFSGLKNESQTKYASWNDPKISWDNGNRQLSFDQSFFFGFLNRVKDKFYITNGLANRLYEATIKGETVAFVEKEEVISNEITGFDLSFPRPIFKPNLDPELLKGDNLKTWKFVEITPNKVGNLGLITLSDNTEINFEYIKIEQISDIELKISYEDPKIKAKYPWLINYQIYTDFQPKEHDEAVKSKLETPQVKSEEEPITQPTDPNNQTNDNTTEPKPGEKPTTPTEQPKIDDTTTQPVEDDSVASEEKEPVARKTKTPLWLEWFWIIISIILGITGLGFLLYLILLKKRKKNHFEW